MPKKSTTARGGAQRGRSRTQKSFELVRPVVETQEQEPETQDEVAIATASVSKASTATTPAVESAPLVGATKPAKEAVTSTSTTGKTTTSGTASSRLAARRQAAQPRTQRIATPLVTAEHYAYVRKDLMFIAILAIIMFSVIIILHFTLG